jgi:hypothetical protein
MKTERTLLALFILCIIGGTGCTSVSLLDISHYKNDPSVLTDGEEVTLTTKDNLSYKGSVTNRNTDSLTLDLPSGEKRIFSVDTISHFTSDKFSAAKTTGLVFAVAGGVALVWVIVVTVTLVGVLVSIPILILG